MRAPARLLRCAAVLVVLCVASACSSRSDAPSGVKWGLPVYPGAAIAGSSTAKASSFVLYRTPDALDDVYDWYVRALPPGTPRAYSAYKRQATFALFDARARRTVHLAREGAATTILLTNLTD